MTQWKPDPTFYPSPRLAMQGPPDGAPVNGPMDGPFNGPEDGPPPEGGPPRMLPSGAMAISPLSGKKAFR